MADNPKKPYGESVTYADPGYQKDGKARYPLDSEAHCRAAWSYINQADNAAQYTAEQLANIKGRIKAALKKFGVDVTDDSKAGSSRADESVDTAPMAFCRSYPLEDCSVRSGGDGRTVEAYAAVFDVPVPIKDQEGEYVEVIDRGAFDRAINTARPSGGREAWRCGVFYNHGMTLHGTPSERASLPIGITLEMRSDARGLFTVTRYLNDEILDLIKGGALSAYSFSGSFQRSTPAPPAGGRFRSSARGDLTTVRRMQSTLREYGPTPFPAYQEAAIVGMRAEQAALLLGGMTPSERTRLAELINPGAPTRGLADTEDSPAPGRSGRSIKEQMSARMAEFLHTHPEGTPV
jgi:HK97 family phage prohead protease